MAVVVVVATELTLVNGSGLDEWRLTPKQISRYMLWTYISEILYNTIIMTTKIAVVLLYLPLTYSYGAVSVSYDVLIFFLPIHSLLKLNITWQRKVGVCAVFLVGFVVTIIAIVRLQYLIRYLAFPNIGPSSRHD
ncbi:hypothetical protein PRZ48_011947 [Zasmidium cellare]|uniref:Rhodopsin domain-containing protein n=1 Tax=Zasmidium cellare TaxID=395010 RepID=A0ABR0E8E4_ZASCE|nr:hypothetical protein PRZ48_011947 [Zasmidium cellare]